MWFTIIFCTSLFHILKGLEYVQVQDICQTAQNKMQKEQAINKFHADTFVLIKWKRLRLSVKYVSTCMYESVSRICNRKLVPKRNPILRFVNIYNILKDLPLQMNTKSYFIINKLILWRNLLNFLVFDTYSILSIFEWSVPSTFYTCNLNNKIFSQKFNWKRKITKKFFLPQDFFRISLEFS